MPDLLRRHEAILTDYSYNASVIEVLCYIFYFIAATISPLQRRHIALKRTNDAGQLDFAFHIMLITFVLSVILVVFKHPELNQSWYVAGFLAVVCGISGATSIGTQYIAQRHVEAGITQLISNIYTPVSIILASLLLNEGLEARQIAGTIILLIAVVLVSSKHRISRWSFDKYFWLNVASGIALAFCLTAERALIKNNNITTGTWLSWGAQVVCLAIAALIAGTRSQHNLKETSATGGLRFLQQISWVVLVTVVANLSLVTAITTFKIVIVFITAAIFLNEREDLKRKIIGSLIATAGLLLMI